MAWNTKAYDAWMIHLGTPNEQAEKLQKDPQFPLRRWLKFIGEPKGKQIINLLGSTGGKAIPLAMLGAEVTIVDRSEQNMRSGYYICRCSHFYHQWFFMDPATGLDRVRLSLY